jgi:hypothetical protein
MVGGRESDLLTSDLNQLPGSPLASAIDPEDGRLTFRVGVDFMLQRVEFAVEQRRPWVPLSFQRFAGNSHRASLLAAAQKSYLNKLNALNTLLNRKPFLPQRGLFGASGRPRRGGRAASSLARGSQPSMVTTPIYLIAVMSAVRNL